MADGSKVCSRMEQQNRPQTCYHFSLCRQEMTLKAMRLPLEPANQRWADVGSLIVHSILSALNTLMSFRGSKVAELKKSFCTRGDEGCREQEVNE